MDSRSCCSIQLLASLSSLLLVSVSAQSSTGTSGSSAVQLPAFDTFDSSYQIDWSVVYAANPPAAFSIPENTELGPCVCDLTFNQCDVNCKCDSVWSVDLKRSAAAVCVWRTHSFFTAAHPPHVCVVPACVLLSSLTDIGRFSSSLKEGPVVTTVKTCIDPDLITVNQRGGMTVALVDNMLCVADDNSQCGGTRAQETKRGTERRPLIVCSLCLAVPQIRPRAATCLPPVP